MLYNISIVLIIALVAIFSFFAGANVFERGFELGKCDRSTEKTPKTTAKKTKKAPKPSPEVARVNNILANIERYDGTSAGQEDIK